jgi:hypothetical protein
MVFFVRKFRMKSSITYNLFSCFGWGAIRDCYGESLWGLDNESVFFRVEFIRESSSLISLIDD